MPASTLNNFSAAVKADNPSLGVTVPSTGPASAARDARAFMRRWGLTWNVPLSCYRYTHDCKEIEVPYLSPLKMLPYLLERAPGLLFGGLDAVQGQGLLSSFWSAYKQTHGEHSVYRDHYDSLATTLPIAVHGDEGRGVRKGNTCILSVESVFGLSTASNIESATHHHACRCCSGTGLDLEEPVRSQTPCSDLPPASYQALTTKGHCFLTRFLVFMLPSSLSKESDLIDGLLDRVFSELRQLYWEGFHARGRWWSCALIGCKGDLAWLAKIGSLVRSFRNLSDTPKEMCHECLGGGVTYPYEDLRAVPRWSTTIFVRRPWNLNAPPSVVKVPFDAAAPEKVLRRDIFHNTKVGMCRDFLGSAILLLCELKYFHHPTAPGTSNARSVLLQRARNHFRLYCLAVNKSAALRTFTKDNFNCQTRKNYGWISCKGSDATLLVEWICILTRACINDPLDAAHVPLLELLNGTARSANDWMKAMYKHGMWLTKPCATALYKEGRHFVVNYNTLAFKCLHEIGFFGFAIKPKAHMIAHTLYEQKVWLDNPAVSLIPSPLLWSCEGGEDLIGRISRISRRSHQSRVMTTTLERYLLKTKCLHDRWRKDPGLKRKAEEHGHPQRRQR